MRYERERESEMDRKVITWDEETIAEHNKERGTRQKVRLPLCCTFFILRSRLFFLYNAMRSPAWLQIDEPPTPYQYDDVIDKEELNEIQGLDELEKREENTVVGKSKYPAMYSQSI